MRILRGVPQHEISGSVAHAQQLIFSSLRGFRDVLNSYRELEDVAAMDTSTGTLTICLPSSLLSASLGPTRNMVHYPGSEPVQVSSSIMDVSLTGVHHAFLSAHISVEGLSWTAKAFIESQETTTQSILDVVETLFNAIVECSQGRTVATELFCRYILMCREFPTSIPRVYTLDPLERVLAKALADGGTATPINSSGVSI